MVAGGGAAGAGYGIGKLLGKGIGGPPGRDRGVIPMPEAPAAAAPAPPRVAAPLPPGATIPPEFGNLPWMPSTPSAPAAPASATGPGVAVRNNANIPATFIGQEGGPSIVVPKAASGPVPADNGLGVKYVGGAGGPGLDPRVSSVRIMEPTAPAGPSPGYPNGYAVYSNASGQAVNPLTGQTLPKYNPWRHIDLRGK
jgi:hypothetical protein